MRSAGQPWGVVRVQGRVLVRTKSDFGEFSLLRGGHLSKRMWITCPGVGHVQKIGCHTRNLSGFAINCQVDTSPDGRGDSGLLSKGSWTTRSDIVSGCSVGLRLFDVTARFLVSRGCIDIPHGW